MKTLLLLPLVLLAGCSTLQHQADEKAAMNAMHKAELKMVVLNEKIDDLNNKLSETKAKHAEAVVEYDESVQHFIEVIK